MKRFASVPARREAWRARWRRLPRGWRIAVLSVFAMLLLAFLAAVLFRQRIGGWIWPDPRAGELRRQAGMALAAGRLSVADGSGARELYESALALQPDQVEAREQAGHRLQQVGQCILASFDRTLVARLQREHALVERQGRIDAVLQPARRMRGFRRVEQRADAGLRGGVHAQQGFGRIDASLRRVKLARQP